MIEYTARDIALHRPARWRASGLSVLFAFTVALDASAQTTKMRAPQISKQSFFSLVDELIEKKPMNSLAFSDLLDRDRYQEGEQAKTFNFYEFRAFFLADAEVEKITFWEENSRLGRGPRVEIDLGKGCIPQGEIKRRYGPLSVSDIPLGHSAWDDFSFSRDMSWGKITFRFPDGLQQCLERVDLEFQKGA